MKTIKYNGTLTIFNSGLVKESIAPLSDNLTIKVITVDGEKTLQCLAIQQNQ